MDRKQTTAVAILAAAASVMEGVGFAGFRVPSARRVRNYPQPPCSSPEVIAEWNANVTSRQVRRWNERHSA